MARCGSRTNTQSHHITYTHHGYEHRPDVIKSDLIVLCKECHQAERGKVIQYLKERGITACPIIK